MFVFQGINKTPVIQSQYLKDKAKIEALPDDNKELRKTVATSLPDQRKIAAWEYAARLNALPDKSSSEFTEGIDFLLAKARASSGDVRVVMCAAALAASASAPNLADVQNRVIQMADDDYKAGNSPLDGNALLDLANNYNSTVLLRDIQPVAPPPPTPSKTAPGAVVKPLKGSGKAQGNTSASSEQLTYMQIWPGQDLLQVFLEAKDLILDPVNFKIQSYFGEMAGAGGKKALEISTSSLLQNFYDQYSRTKLQISVNPSAYQAAGRDFINTVHPDFFLDENWGNVKGAGKQAHDYLYNGQLVDFFKMLAQNPNNTMASEVVSKFAQGSYQYYKTTYLGSVDIYYEPGKGLSWRMEKDKFFIFPNLFLSGFAWQISYFARDLYSNNIQFTGDYNNPAKLSDPIEKLSQGFLQHRLSGSFLLRLKLPDKKDKDENIETGTLLDSFFVEPALLYSRPPTGLNINPGNPARNIPQSLEGVRYEDQVGWSVRVSNTDPHTGKTYRPDSRWGMDWSKLSTGGFSIHPDVDFLLQKDPGNPLTLFSYVSMKAKIEMGYSTNEANTSENKLSSYDVLYIESGLKFQSQGALPDAYTLMFVPKYQYAFSKTTSIIVSGQAGYNIGLKRLDQVGGEVRGIFDHIYVAGGINYVNQNYVGFSPATPTVKISVGWMIP